MKISGKDVKVPKQLIDYMKDCKCEFCLGKKCYYSSEYCHVVEVLESILPGWFEKRQTEIFRLGRWGAFLYIKEFVKNEMESNKIS